MIGLNIVHISVSLASVKRRATTIVEIRPQQ
jgi:hypothetical protein